MSRFLIPRPRSGDGTVLPAALAAILAGALALQVVLVPAGDADSAAPRRALVRRPFVAPLISAAVADPAITARPIFTPARANGGSASGADPLGGAQVSGTWSVGRQTNLVLRLSDGTVRTLRVGQTVNQWVLSAITSGGARFSREGQSINVPFGASAPPSAQPQEEQSQ